MKILWSVIGLSAVLAGCVTPQPVVRAVPQAEGAPPALVVSRRIAYDGAGAFILPDGSTVAADASGGFTLPNGAYAAPDGAGGVILPNGTRCSSDGARGYLCP